MENKLTSKPNRHIVTIITKDQKTLKIEKRLAFRSNLIKAMLEDRHDTDEPVPILQFDEKTILKVFDFIRHEIEVERLPEIPKPVPTERLHDCVP